ncbi:MAG: hypothetical protein HWE27_12110 [Gammaproteobacteria bacterium]|nr:hypothetical protein [Gammaproteobacteria bacterium]
MNRNKNGLYFQNNGGWNIETCASNPLPVGLMFNISKSGRTESDEVMRVIGSGHGINNK